MVDIIIATSLTNTSKNKGKLIFGLFQGPSKVNLDTLIINDLNQEAFGAFDLVSIYFLKVLKVLI